MATFPLPLWNRSVFSFCFVFFLLFILRTCRASVSKTQASVRLLSHLIIKFPWNFNVLDWFILSPQQFLNYSSDFPTTPHTGFCGNFCCGKFWFSVSACLSVQFWEQCFALWPHLMYLRRNVDFLICSGFYPLFIWSINF